MSVPKSLMLIPSDETNIPITETLEILKSPNHVG
jgi:hypothetical protein